MDIRIEVSGKIDPDDLADCLRKAADEVEQFNKEYTLLQVYRSITVIDAPNVEIARVS